MARSSKFLPLGLMAFAALPAAPAAAQVNCADLYNRMIALYQTAPQSPEYAQMAASYNGYCVAGASPAPAAGDPGGYGGFGGSGGHGGSSSGALPLRGAPSGTIPTESRALPSGRHK
ncbi:MAG TPA: hypothetical protein VFA12_00450 [Stellaceae bacterium]|nr:hypothetical protein [Stellaceae bacterium]